MPDAVKLAPPTVEPAAGSGRAELGGAWLTATLERIEALLAAAAWPAGGPLMLDVSRLAALDTGGAWRLLELLTELRERGLQVELTGLREEFGELLALVEQRLGGFVCPLPPPPPSALERVGRHTHDTLLQAFAFLSFIGETMIAIGQALRRPGRIRWRQLLQEIETTGVDALPIIGLLSFLIGVVIAYQGGVQLRNYGANIFVVELVALTVLRELAPMMTAVIVAGRTGSAYTAQVGTMVVNEEIDALRTMGIAPVDLLVLPKLFGLMVALPLLTMFADVLGILGGMVMSAVMLDVDASEFLRRLPEAVSVTSFLIGIGKAPVFAMLIALVGCFQGFQVSGGADSVGRQTTVSVVQGIFLVIVADAIFSVILSGLGV